MNAPYARDIDAALALLLLDTPGYGPRKVTDLLTKADSAQDAYDLLLRDASSSEKVRDHMSRADPESYLEVVSATRAVGGDFKLWNDDDYPANLTKWSARPPVLFFKGSLDRLSTRALALVGRVDPTDRGIDAATRFGRMCVDNEIQIISGLAKGIDGASHRAALQEPAGTTFAVLGHGIDFSYPAENSDLYAAIPENGALLSQFPTGTGPQRWTFPARNEAMCTLALGTVIIEGKEGCGSIIQADFSFKHGRPVFLLSRNLKTDDSEWAEKLVKRGAHVIEYFEQAVEIVEKTTGDLWGEKLSQGTFFDVQKGEISLNSSENVGQPACAALFDLDGVVIDSREAQVSTLAQLAADHLGRSVDSSQISALGSPTKALQALGVSNAWNVYKSNYDRALSDHLNKVRVFEDVVSEILKLKAAGVVVAAITSQPQRRFEAMVPKRVQDLFEFVLTYSMYTKGDKSDGIAKALRRTSIEAERAVYVGDQSTDLDAARKAGVSGIGVLWGFSEETELKKWTPDLLIGDQSQVALEVLSILRPEAASL